MVVLDQNYRSTQIILQAANAVIDNNLSRKPKELWTDAGRGDLVHRFFADDETDEARWLAQECARLHDGGTYRWSDMAVFYRTNAQSRVLEEALMRAGIPYRVVGGTRFYDRKEIKDVLAYLRAVLNPTDEVSVKRVVNEPKRGVGQTSVDKIDRWAAAEGVSFMEALRSAPAAGVSGRAVRGVSTFVELLDELRDMAEGVHRDQPASPASLLEEILDRTGYSLELENQGGVEAEGRLENLAELIGVAQEFDTVDEFLEQVSLIADTDDLDEDESAVTLMTLHSAKGLEYPVVFLLGLEEGVFPHIRSLGEPAELEEERRLCYVGITRAMERLFVGHAWCRSLYGTTQYNPPSRFLEEIPAELITEIEGSRSARQQRSSRGSLSGGAGRSAAGRENPRRSAGPSEFGGRIEMVDRAVEAGKAAVATMDHAGADEDALRVGDDVRHATFGEGVVVELIGSGDKAEVVVNFPSAGEKRLLVSWAPLERV